MDRYEAHDFIRQIRALHKYHGHALRPAVRNEMGSGLGAIQKFLDVLHGAHLVFRRVRLIHSELFRQTMRGLGLRDDFGAYIDSIPAVTLAAVNMISLFGMHRRLRGAITGHLALYEMTSSIPQAAYARGFRRLGYESPVTDYFDEHVEADAVHEQIAGRDLAGGLAEDEPDLVPDIIFGAQAAAAVDALAGAKYSDAWEAGRSALHAGAGAVV